MSKSELTPAEERVKAYLEEQSKTDTALATLYAPSKIKDCYKYITEQAQKAASGDSYFADDAEVWKWARDYFIEELPKKAEKIPVEVAAKTEPEDPAVDVTPIQETVKAVAETVEADAASDNVKRDEYGFEVFGEETEEPEAEKNSAEEPCRQEEEVKKDNHCIVADEYDNICNFEQKCSTCPVLNDDVNDNVFFDGQAFNAGDIIDKAGRRLFWADMKVGQRFVHKDFPDAHLYMTVCIVKKIKEAVNQLHYEAGEIGEGGYLILNQRECDDEISRCSGWVYAVPEDAKIIGTMKDAQRKMFEEAKDVDHSYDSEGNGLLFGF